MEQAPNIVNIPTTMDPFIVTVNGQTYSYPAGTQQEVPDAVADVIRNIDELSPVPKEADRDGQQMLVEASAVLPADAEATPQIITSRSFQEISSHLDARGTAVLRLSASQQVRFMPAIYYYPGEVVVFADKAAEAIMTPDGIEVDFNAS